MNEEQRNKLISILVSAAAYPGNLESYMFKQTFGEDYKGYKSTCYMYEIGHLLKLQPEKCLQEYYNERHGKDPGFRGCTDGSRDQALISKKYNLELVRFVAREIVGIPIIEPSDE